MIKYINLCEVSCESEYGNSNVHLKGLFVVSSDALSVQIQKPKAAKTHGAIASRCLLQQPLCSLVILRYP